MKTTILLVAALLAAMSSRAVVITWTNTGNGNWSVPAHWNPNQVPSTNDTAVITNAGTYTVTLNLDPTIAGLVLGGESGTQTLSTAEQTLTLNGSGAVGPRGVFNLALGTLTGANSVNLEGILNWSGGTINSNAAVTITSGGQMQIASGANFAKHLYGHLTNHGTITWQLYGGLRIGGVLHNAGLFDTKADLTLYRTGNGVIVNEGVFRKSVGAGTVSCEVPLINSGTVDTQLGTVVLSDGSVFNSGCAFIGAGGTRLDSGTNTINGEVHSENLSLLYGATLTGTGSLSGTLTWGGGNLGPDAAITVATNGNLLIASAANYVKNVHGRLTNAGTITWQPHSGLLIGGVLHNLPGALFDAQCDETIYQGGAGVIINDGRFQKSAGVGSTDCEVPFINNGTAKVSAGTLNFEGVYTNPVGTILLAGGIFRTIPPLWLAGGLLTGWGTVSADVTNAACIRPARSNGVLTISGKCNQLLGGRMEFELAGNVPGTNQSRLNITGAATLRGTVGVNWNEGYMPPPGTNFPVLSFASRQGEFCCFDNFLLLGQGRRLTPVYSATNFTLATVAAPEPTTVPLGVTVDGGALVCWPVEFPGYDLYWSTNLSQTNWTLLAGATNHWLEAPPLPRELFFRLHKP